jgi:imidazolonepropionase-like amidohydrolase
MIKTPFRYLFNLQLLTAFGLVFTLALSLAATPAVKAQSESVPPASGVADAPPRAEGEGPFPHLIIRGATLIDGTGAPPTGPVDVVIENDRIVSIQTVGFPGVPINENRRPALREGGREIDAHGMYLLPGFVDVHAHIGGRAQGTPSEYVFKLWMGHGITTIRDPGSGNGLDWTLLHREKSARNEITAPRIKSFLTFGRGSSGPITTPEQARAWVARLAANGGDGIKFFGLRPDIMEAALDEARRRGLRTTAHHAQLNVAWQNTLQSARMGLNSMEHWYGLPEAMLEGSTVQNYRLDYNYMNEQHRFEEAGKLWREAAPPGSDRWNAVMNELIDLDFTLVPTFNIYEANRDLMRARRAEWHEEYTLPSLWEFFQPSRVAHGSYWLDWGTEQEVLWRDNYRLWMAFVNEYKNRGGRVAAGSDSGFIFQVYGFGFIRELELLREAGFHPLEVIRAATLKGAEILGMQQEIGSVEPGKKADLVLVSENPLQNLQVLYGTGAIRVNVANEVVRVGGVAMTIKDGIVYDARQLLADVRAMVRAAKDETGYEIVQPGHRRPQSGP